MSSFAGWLVIFHTNFRKQTPQDEFLPIPQDDAQ
jgi:hypothetical protein